MWTIYALYDYYVYYNEYINTNYISDDFKQR